MGNSILFYDEKRELKWPKTHIRLFRAAEFWNVDVEDNVRKRKWIKHLYFILGSATEGRDVAGGDFQLLDKSSRMNKSEAAVVICLHQFHSRALRRAAGFTRRWLLTFWQIYYSKYVQK